VYALVAMLETPLWIIYVSVGMLGTLLDLMVSPGVITMVALFETPGGGNRGGIQRIRDIVARALRRDVPVLWARREGDGDSADGLQQSMIARQIRGNILARVAPGDAGGANKDSCANAAEIRRAQAEDANPTADTPLP
jgi:hypothetical protein